MYWSFFLSLNICYDILLWFVVVTFSPPLPFLLQLHLFKFTCWCCNFLALCFVSALFLLTSTDICTWENDGQYQIVNIVLAWLCTQAMVFVVKHNPTVFTTSLVGLEIDKQIMLNLAIHPGEDFRLRDTAGRVETVQK